VAREDVQDHPCGMDVVGQGLGAGGLDRVQAIGEHGTQNLDHLPVAAGLAFQLDTRKNLPGLSVL